MANNNPQEVIQSPYTVYISTGPGVYPDPTAAPDATEWTEMGPTTRQADGTGVTVTSDQTGQDIRVEGYTGPLKWVRLTEDQTINFRLLDLKPATLKHAISGDAPTEVAASDKIGLSRSLNTREVHLLMRGASPLKEGANAQWEIPRAVHIGSPAIQYSKGAVSGIDFEFKTLVDTTASATGEEFGRYVVGKV